MDKAKIETRARELHREIWSQAPILWPGKTGLSIVEIVDPEIAAKVLNLTFERRPELAGFSHPLAPLEEVAGVLDRDEQKILISEQYSPEIQRFTAAHEIGHYLNHGHLKETILHRDRPIEGLTKELGGRPWYEREADYFAACFLIPRKRLIEAFEYVFSMKAPFIFDYNDAADLKPKNPTSLLKPKDDLVRALALAAATRFRGKCFVPLHQQFGVSVTSMAIRIKELGLIRDS